MEDARYKVLIGKDIHSNYIAIWRYMIYFSVIPKPTGYMKFCVKLDITQYNIIAHEKNELFTWISIDVTSVIIWSRRSIITLSKQRTYVTDRITN